jgi:hypothetical protein
MVRAILEGRKTQTRRLMKLPSNIDEPILQSFHKGFYGANYGGKPFGVKHGFVPLNKMGGIATKPFHDHFIICPYGKPGDRLWVRETFYSWRCKTYSSAGSTEGPDQAVYAADGGHVLNGAKWRPSIHMPRWASRIMLELTEVRVQRLQEISEADARAEGVERLSDAAACLTPWKNYRLKPGAPFAMNHSIAAASFMSLWDSINGDQSSNANPWVWAITFKRIEA